MQRAEVLAALANVLLLTVVAVWVVIEAIRRWNDPATIESGLMIAAAGVGAAANLVCLLILRTGKEKSLNVRGAYLEVLGDLLGSLAVIVAGVVIATTDFERADVIASLVIAAMIAPRVWRLFRDVADVLLEATPRDVNLAHVREHITDIPGVVDVHDLHAWTITSGVPVLSAHVVVEDECLSQGRSGEVLDRLGECLAGHFDVEHCTFQIEPVGHQSHESGHHQ
jgi:cobalt-zinc-cadmium efflux system protein